MAGRGVFFWKGEQTVASNVFFFLLLCALVFVFSSSLWPSGLFFSL